jgi:UDP:flavonoid glycosyltransferase YjiC (YdhE family)
MRITIITIGTRGDVQPYVALGLGLQAAGHEVCVATHLPFESFIRDYGLQFFPIKGDPSQMLRSKPGHDLTGSGANVVRFFRALQTIGGPLTAAILTDVWNACQRADSVIYSSLGVMCFRIPEILGVPGIGAFLNPLSRTRTVPI